MLKWSKLTAAVQRNPILCFAATSAAFCAYWEVSTARSQHAILTTTQASITRAAETTSTELRDLLRATDAKFAVAMKQREELTRQLQLQNVEQTKSVARLHAALRMCVRDPQKLLGSVTTEEVLESQSVE